VKYVRLVQGLTKSKLIPITENIWDHIISNDKDYYVSIYNYNDDHYKKFKETGSVSGIRDVTTNKLVFDFDDNDNTENARQDAITLVSRLISAGIPENTIQVTFSGNKGFGVQVDTIEEFTPEEFKNITSGLAGDLKTFDKVVSDPNRIIRVVGTKHQKSKLYKMPISVAQLAEMDVETIKKFAASLNNVDEDLIDSWTTINLPPKILDLKNKKEQKQSEVIVSDLDLSQKPKWLSDAKYALQQGFFKNGERNTAFMILASTYKSQGFPKEIIYRMLKGVAELQAKRNNSERYSDEELYNNIVEVVCSPNWKGGTYSYENTPLLQEVTKRLGLKVPKKEELPLVPVSSVSSIFKKFATEIELNTIKLGIDEIDRDIRITTSMLVGLLAAPSAGKTSVSMSVLNTVSKAGLRSIFFSLDMGAPLVFQRLIQKHTGIHSNKLFEMYRKADPKIFEFENKIAEEYKNVSFCFSSGVTVEDIREMILAEQDRTGEKVKLIVVDYLENISGPYSDPTANTALIAQKLKDVANELELTVLLLLQTQKQGGDPSDELVSMRSIKGSSAIEQACSVIFTMNRPGFSPKNPEDDKYLSILVVKNRMGQLSSYDFKWDGLTGSIRSLTEEERSELHEFKKKKATEKAQQEL
jgi:KaiC/GvpD/RAD55 family RecA-like ATPase